MSASRVRVVCGLIVEDRPIAGENVPRSPSDSLSDTSLTLIIAGAPQLFSNNPAGHSP